MLSLLEKRPWLKNYDYKFPWTINYPKIPVFRLLRDAVSRDPDKAATWFYGSEITFWEMYMTSIRMANALKELGIQKGDRVGLLMPNCPQTVISFWSISALGAIIVNLNPMLTVDEITYCQKVAEMKAVITFEMCIPLVKSLCQKTDLPIVLVTKVSDFINGSEKSTAKSLGLEEGWYHFSEVLDASTSTKPPYVDIDVMEDPVLIQFTGGTTGIPKGATITHYNFVAACFQTYLVGQSMIWDMKDLNLMCTLPLVHIFGELSGLGWGVLNHATAILVPRFNIDEIFDILDKFDKITFWNMVPTMWAAIISHPKAAEYHLEKKVAIMGSGGGPMPQEYLGRIHDLHLFFMEGWGMSETCGEGTATPTMGWKKEYSIGFPYPDNDVRFVNPDTLEDVEPGTPGEMWMKGPTVMKGYWNNPEATEDVFHDGWLRTGDLAYMDEDGFIFIVDRLKDMIIAGGYNIYPREIDDVLFKHPDVIDAITIGIPDAYRGETVKSFIQLAEGATVTEEEIIKYCREHLSAYKVPRFIEFRAALPHSAVGKALRRKLRDEEIAKLKK